MSHIYEYFEEVTKKIDEDSAVDIIYIDFCKAFDRVPYGWLVWNFRLHGIYSELANLIHNWLEGKRKRVVVDGCFTEWETVACSVS